MKKLVQFLLCCSLFYSTQAFSEANEKANFWQTTKNGANYKQTLPITNSFYTHIKKDKSSFIYFIPNRDFFSQASDIRAQWENALKNIENLLENAKKHDLKVVFELPQASCMPFTFIEGKDDSQIVEVWLKIVAKLKNYPEVVAYSIPSIPFGRRDDRFQRKVIAKIRKIDPDTSIISKLSYGELPKQAPEKNILYAMESKIMLPTVCLGTNDKFPSGEELDAREQELTQRAKDNLKNLSIWVKQNGISPQQILIWDFGSIDSGSNTRSGLYKTKETELASFLEIIKANNWHWSFSY